MFKYVSTHFASATGQGSLIAVNSVDQANSIKLLQVVVMERKREYGLWTKKEYRPYDFLLGDLLTATKPAIKVDGQQSEFCTWKKNFTFTIKGKFGVGMMNDLADVNVRSKDKVTVQANLGKVNMTKVDSEELLAALSDRRLNVEHTLVQQIRQNKKKVLCIVTAVAQLDGNAEIHRVSSKGGGAGAEAEKKGGGDDAGGGDEGGGDEDAGGNDDDGGGGDGDDDAGGDDGGGDGDDDGGGGDDGAGGDDETPADDAVEGGGEENDETGGTADDDAAGADDSGDGGGDDGGGDDSGGGDAEDGGDDSGDGDADAGGDTDEPAAEEPAADSDAPPPGVKLRKEFGLCKGAVVAFKVWELEIGRKSGRVVPCVLQGQNGGFKPDHMVGSGKKFLDLIIS